MPKKYAIRINEDTIDLIRALQPIVDVVVTEDYNRFFLLTADAKTTTQHDVVEEDDLVIYDGNDSEPRIILQ